MQNDLLLNTLLIVVIFCSYFLWRKREAIKSREKLADKVDTFLDSDADEAIKEFVYKFYEVSLFSLFSIIALIFFVRKALQKTSKKNNNNNKLTRALKSASKSNTTMLKSILAQGAKVILNRAPITTLICMILLVIFVILQVLFDKMSFNKIFGDPADVLDDTIKHCH